MISDMQKEQEFEQELQEKGLRNIIEGLPVEGVDQLAVLDLHPPLRTQGIANSQITEDRKTKSVVEDVDEEVEPSERTIDSDVNDDGDLVISPVNHWN